MKTESYVKKNIVWFFFRFIQGYKIYLSNVQVNALIFFCIFQHFFTFFLYFYHALYFQQKLRQNILSQNIRTQFQYINLFFTFKKTSMLVMIGRYIKSADVPLIHFFLFTKSYFHSTNQQLIHIWKTRFFSVLFHSYKCDELKHEISKNLKRKCIQEMYTFPSQSLIF